MRRGLEEGRRAGISAHPHLLHPYAGKMIGAAPALHATGGGQC
jgi:hypothetical protein